MQLIVCWKEVIAVAIACKLLLLFVCFSTEVIICDPPPPPPSLSLNLFHSFTHLGWNPSLYKPVIVNKLLKSLSNFLDKTLFTHSKADTPSCTNSYKRLARRKSLICEPGLYWLQLNLLSYKVAQTHKTSLLRL